MSHLRSQRVLKTLVNHEKTDKIYPVLYLKGAYMKDGEKTISVERPQ